MSRRSAAEDAADGMGQRYSAPALEKGLDILELLSGEADGLTQTAIAAALGRSVHEVFRMVNCLERRGYIARRRPDDAYALTMRLHELAHRYPPSRRLLDAALPEMRRLARATLQSCHLGVCSAGRLYVVAQVESPAPVGFTVRPGSDFALARTASGRVLLAFQPADLRREWLDAAQTPEAGTPEAEERALLARIGEIAARGFERVADDTLAGVTDLSVPILDRQGHALAALTIPYLKRRDAAVGLDAAMAELSVSARAISAQTGGPETR